jgi:UDP-N-acetylmuramyl pentapeptide phosphotransferase/UDP-N-acetylglucosamine-1-phosphate transferase
MMEIIIPLVIIIGIVLAKLSTLRSSVLVILGEMTHFLGGFVDLLLKISKTKHLLLLPLDLLIDYFEVPNFLVQLLLLRRWTCSLPFFDFWLHAVFPD